MNYKIGMISLGCAKNQTDAEIMLGLLNEDGCSIVQNPDDADILIVNTCGFIDIAKQESIDTILEMAEYKKSNCKALIVTGCLAQRYKNEILSELPEIDAILGVSDYDKIVGIIKDVMQKHDKKPILCGDINDDVPEGLPRMLSTPNYTAYLKIAEGCDNNCTYCAIPKIRGHFRSRKMVDILDEAKRLSDSGVTELIVIAQDTTRYGIDLYGEYKLAELLSALCKIDNIHWVRVHYFYTEAITDDLVKVFHDEPKLCNYVDMPIQHINNEILRRMARRTNKEEIIKRIKDFRNSERDITIRTSIIVGFPGETEKQFNELYDFIKEIKFDRMGVFKYSPEENTPAAEFCNQIDDKTKQERLDKLMELQKNISLENNKNKMGKEIEVLCEGYDEDNFLYYGRSRGDSIDVDGTIYFAADDEVKFGEYVNVKLLDYDEYDLTGEMVY